ncbi:MAG: glycosyltransferase 87 family protein, partial [Propionibacterium acidifaciens]
MRPSHGAASGVERLRRRPPLSDWVGVVAWLGTRSVMALVLATLCLFVREDVGYYAAQLQGVPTLHPHGLGGTLVEYPVPVVWLLEALRVPAGASSAVYVYAFALLMVLLDTVCCWALWRHHSRLGALLWIGFTFCIGPLLWFRIDLVPAVCVLVAAHQRNRRPVLSGAAVGLGAAMKLWPALLVLPLLGVDGAG